MKRPRLEHVNDDMLATEVRVMIFYSALSQVMKVGCITMTQLHEFYHPTSPRIKNSEFSLPVKNAW